MITTVQSRGRRDRGTASIELVALMPMVLMVVVLALQVLIMAYTAHAASQAARDAARAYSLEASPQSAAAASLPGAVSLVSVNTFGPHHGVRVVVEAPAMLFLSDRQISRQVTMP
jgi:Flp pilus assembly protein TadG